jgi:hypothetical protein
MKKIFVFDNKEINVDAAELAIKAAGHEMSEISWVPLQWFDVVERVADREPNIKVRNVRINQILSVAREMIEQARSNEGGIIVDLMFHMSPYGGPDEKPCGLLLALHAISRGVPVVICTQADEVGGHHSEAMSWIFDGYVARSIQEGWFCPFGWVDNKDYAKAVKLLEERMAKE